MALTLKEQMDIIEFRIGPELADGGDPDCSFMDLIHISSYNEAINFKLNIKDTTGNADAEQYVTKLQRILKGIILENGAIREALLFTLVSIGAPNTDIATIQGLTITGWENFVSNNMLETIELLSNITAAEKAAYDAL